MDLMVKSSLATVIANLSSLTRATFASPFVPTKSSDLTRAGSSFSFSEKIVEPEMHLAQNSPLTDEPSLSVAFADTIFPLSTAVVVHAVAMIATAMTNGYFM